MYEKYLGRTSPSLGKTNLNSTIDANFKIDFALGVIPWLRSFQILENDQRFPVMYFITSVLI